MNALTLTDQEFVRISFFLKNKYGIDMSDKKAIIHGRLENYLKARGFLTYSEYMNEVEKDPTGHMESELVGMLSTNHTYFMRENEHFDYLRTVVMPWIREVEESTHDIRIWSAAASSGEEPYAIEMLIRDSLGLEASSWDTGILATDVSEEMLKKAMRGIYEEEQLKSVPDVWKRRYFRNIAGTTNYQVTDELKKGVIFRKFNLMDPFPFRKQMHAVFLRNVMIYFDDETKIQLIQKVYDLLLPGGYLFIGKTETLDRDRVPFSMIMPSIYRKA